LKSRASYVIESIFLFFKNIFGVINKFVAVI